MKMTVDMIDMREKLASLPYSYDDFVRFTMECIEQEDGVKEVIDNQFRIKPDSDTNDITKVVVEFLGLGEPLEIVDDDEIDDEEEMLVGASSRSFARAAY
ncbi:MAG: hypothetical protein IJ058_14455 [Lachnospiraceae bacterium]|nr:hypothetical protein [Lachnospiraceae bacterium]MBQ8947983.1 hypothetical protein [Lachnospiraceae bacterium]